MTEILKTEKDRLRGRPSKKYLATLKTAWRRDYRKLEKACLDAYLLGQNHVIMAVPYVAKFPKGFPNKSLVKIEGTTCFYKLNAKSLLKWLYANGYTSMTGAGIGLAISKFNQEMKELLLELQ